MVRFKTYKRGQLIFFSFMSSIGYELSGKHPAIVITKKDTISNGVLTIIPLSSKEKSYYLPLGDVIAKRVDDFYENRIKIMEESIEELTNIVSNLNKDALEYKNKNEKFSKELIENINNVNFRLKTLNTMNEENIKILSIYKTDFKKTYALIQNITTISKERILKPLGKFDPLNNFIVDAEILDKIDAEIKNRFTR